MLPVDIILIISEYLTLPDVSKLYQTLKDVYDGLALKLILKKFPKLFSILNHPEILGSHGIIPSWDYFMDETSYILIKNIINMKEIIFQCILTNCSIPSETYLSKLLLNNFNNIILKGGESDRKKSDLVIQLCTKDNLKLELIKLIEINKSFIMKLLTILYRDNIEELLREFNIPHNYFNYDIFNLLNVKITKYTGESILSNLIENFDSPRIIKYFRYLNQHHFVRLCVKCTDLVEKAVSENFDISIISYKSLSILIEKNRMDLVKLILDHKDFKLSKDILESACNSCDFKLLKILLNHPSCKY